MTIDEIIQGIQIIKAQAEWDYPLDWQIVLDGAIDTMRKYQKLEQEPTAKNDLGVTSELEKNSKKLEKNFGELDCISREQALVAIRNLYPGMPRVDFNGSLRKWVDKYKPYIECDDAIKQLPSVTSQEPKTGHWVHGEYCSECGCDVPAYIVDWKWQKDMDAKYCPNCGAKMVEPQESEDKE